MSGGTFGQLFSAPVVGQVYAQPLVADGTLFIATEDDNIYGLDPETGAVRWSRNVGTPWNPSDLGCADLRPNIGVTATPVIDPSRNGHGLLLGEDLRQRNERAGAMGSSRGRSGNGS